ncbi:soluble guanylate cyclase gcy-31-like [Diadema setosum]|uniref:soluble guanylate cyclase gcy-31-like n=1 Tax=Diadema setosum TaxID=31175 RepID=UPI003B3BBE8B
MYGLLIESVCEFIKEKFGEAAWLKIRDRSRVHEYTFVTHRMYSEKIIPRLAQAVHDITGYEKNKFMDETGVQFVLFLKKYDYDSMLRVLGRSLRDFLNGLDNLHEYLRFSYPKMKPPSFFCTDESVNGLTLHYRTKRQGYTHYVKGQLKQVAKQFYNRDVKVEVLEERQASKDTLYVKFLLKFDNKEFSARTRLSGSMNGHAQLRANLFFDVFPFHIVFDKDMRITNTGRGLNAILPTLEGTLLHDAFEMKRPNLPLTWESITSHENNVFELASKTMISRDTIALNCPYDVNQPQVAAEDEDQTGSTAPPPVCPVNQLVDDDGDSSEGEILEEVFHPRQIRLKGQMLSVPEWHAYIFLATPMLPDLKVMFHSGLYINDLSMHDSSRDLVLAGTQQSAELKLALDQEQRKSAQLEESMMKLDQEMKRTDSLLYQMIPRQVAEKLRRGEPATNTCEVFSAVTILFSDIVGFTNICSQITPMAVVSMLNGMYTKYDNLSETFDVYKVETIGDAYMVVSGAPTATKYHAVRIVEMGLAMICAIADVKDPSSNVDNMKIRIGVHSGMVVAGVVGLKMPRYCLFGDTVNTASRMESTGEAMKIHMSETTFDNLAQWPGHYVITERGTTNVKGKGTMKTYWLLGKTHGNGMDNPLSLAYDEEKVRSRQSSIDSSPILRRSIAGSRLGIADDAQSNRQYSPVLNDDDRATTPRPSGNLIQVPDNGEKHSFSSTETLKSIGANGNGSAHSRSDGKYSGYIPVTPATSKSGNDVGYACTCRRDVHRINREVQTVSSFDVSGAPVDIPDMHAGGDTKDQQGNGSDNAYVDGNLSEVNKGNANVAHSSACAIL